MRSWCNMVAFFVFTLGVFAASFTSAAAQVETVDKTAVVYSCETVDCANEPDGAKNLMPGATVTSFAADGSEVDSCTTEAGGQCALSIPVAEDGTYIVTPAAGFESFTLVSSTPESTGEGGDGREWTFVPSAAPQPETAEVQAVVYSCETVDCANEPDGAKNLMPGATVTSYTADGTELDSCTTEANGQCALTIPAAEDGTYDVVAAAGFESYTLLSSTPELTGEGGDGREWTFLPAEEPQDVTPVNVVACTDSSCDDAETMDGAELISYQDGTEVDRCVVSNEADDFDGCTLFIPADKADVEIIPAAGYEDYTLLSDEPEVYESEEHGRILLWIFVLETDDESTETPDATATPVGTKTPSAVSALPETGTGTTSGNQGGTIVLAIGGIAALALAALSARLGRR